LPTANKQEEFHGFALQHIDGVTHFFSSLQPGSEYPEEEAS